MQLSIEWARAFSCSSLSETVLPFSMVPTPWITPPAWSIASNSVVLPTAAWPTSAIFRIFSVLYITRTLPCRARPHGMKDAA
jgi:hypothetical protein